MPVEGNSNPVEQPALELGALALHLCSESLVHEQQSAIASRISSADLVHRMGFGPSLQMPRNLRTVFSTDRTPREKPGLCWRGSSTANHHSAWFIHDEYVGVKCAWNHGRHRVTRSLMTWTSFRDTATGLR